MTDSKIGMGGGCHWCTEAVFQALSGVTIVQQGFIRSEPPHDGFSEAVLIEFDPTKISQNVLVEIHLRTHASTSNHKMRGKYRSAVYVFCDEQEQEIRKALTDLQSEFDNPIITDIMPMVEFRPSPERFQNYYADGPQKPFCRTYIDPKLSLLRKEYQAFLGNPEVDEMKDNPTVS